MLFVRENSAEYDTCITFQRNSEFRKAVREHFRSSHKVNNTEQLIKTKDEYNTLKCNFYVNGIEVKSIVDTGTSMSMISED